MFALLEFSTPMTIGLSVVAILVVAIVTNECCLLIKSFAAGREDAAEDHEADSSSDSMDSPSLFSRFTSLFRAKQNEAPVGEENENDSSVSALNNLTPRPFSERVPASSSESASRISKKITAKINAWEVIQYESERASRIASENAENELATSAEGPNEEMVVPVSDEVIDYSIENQGPRSQSGDHLPIEDLVALHDDRDRLHAEEEPSQTPFPVVVDYQIARETRRMMAASLESQRQPSADEEVKGEATTAFNSYISDFGSVERTQEDTQPAEPEQAEPQAEAQVEPIEKPSSNFAVLPTEITTSGIRRIAEAGTEDEDVVYVQSEDDQVFIQDNSIRIIDTTFVSDD